MNTDLNISWKIKMVKLAISAMAVSVQQTLNGRTLDMQENRVFRCRAVITYTAGNGLASSALALACWYLARSYTYTHAHALNRPCVQVFVDVAMLHKCISFIKCIQPFHLPLQAHALINQILQYITNALPKNSLSNCLQIIQRKVFQTRTYSEEHRRVW